MYEVVVLLEGIHEEIAILPEQSQRDAAATK